MKTGRVFGMVAAAVVLGMVYTSAAQAQAVYPAKAKSYKVDLARAMDPCTAGITVVNPGGTQGCMQANTVTDTTVTGAISGTLKVATKKGSPVISIKGKGFTPAGVKASVQLTIRVTLDGLSPAGSKTYQDETILCGDTTIPASTCGSYFLSDEDGKLKGKQTLAACLTANGLSSVFAAPAEDSGDSHNIQIVDAAVINCDTGKAIAVPGVVQR